MPAVYIICEGYTERDFVSGIITPWFVENGIYEVVPILLTTSPGHRGGALNYDRYKYNVKGILNSRTDIILTSLIDFYKIDNKFPGYVDSANIRNKAERLSAIESAIAADINHRNFNPYIQLHELEGLLFSDINGFEAMPEINNKRPEVENIIQEYPNPEDINDGETTAPSKRLCSIFPGYDKRVHCLMIAEKTGTNTMIRKCPRFGNWLNIIKERARG